MSRFIYFYSGLLLVFILACNHKTIELSEKTATYELGDTYTSLEELLPRLTAKKNDNTIYIVNFWATWCGQCRKEIPEMVKLDEKYRQDNNVKILFVNVDEPDRHQLVMTYMKKFNITGEVVAFVDPYQDKWIEAIDSKWNGSLPGTLFFKGDKHRKFYGYPLSYNELERNIEFMNAKK